MGPRLSLVVIRAADLTRSRRFYESLGLTFREERHGSGPPHLACELGDAVFEIYPSGSIPSPTVGTRIGFRIGDINAAVASVPNLGGEIVSFPKDSAWGRRAVLRDPDGHTVELLEEPPG
ncbi:MAG TPA: VOC family protein [Pirellulaceae bacterium]|nr:VOC family protein [Pirellulaceae bacterium]